MKKHILLLCILATFTGCKKENEEENKPVPAEAPWSQISKFDSLVFLRCIFADGKEIYAGTDQNVYFSADNGSSWTNVSNIQGLGLRQILVDGKDVWGGQSVMGFFHSTDKGRTWTQVENGIPKEETIYSLSKADNNLYVGTSGSGLFRSTNNGYSFEQIFSFDTIGAPIWQTASQGSNVVIAIWHRGIFCSNNNGDTWQDISLKSTPEFNPYGLHIFNNIIYVTNGMHVYRRSVFDTDWIECTKNLILNSFFWDIHSQGNKLFVGTEYGISYSTDEALNWTNLDLSKKMQPNSMWEISSNDEYIFATDQHDVWRIKL